MVSWWHPGTVMELSWNWQGARKVLLVCQFQTTCMPAWMPSYYVQRSDRNHRIVLAKIKQRYTAPYCAFSSRHFPVTFSQLSRNPIYMHLCYNFRIQSSDRPIWLPKSAPSYNPTIAYLLPVCCKHIPEYIPGHISRKMKVSPNILYNNSGEAFIFGYISGCISFTICWLSLPLKYWRYYLGRPIYTRLHTSVRVAFFHYFI